ncbi:MAG: tetratricopeptide repeat protein, partial [Planctomycetota bacterium]|nr:tetratricopeptide repeat protein [Planctomycetota bacterium]
QATRTLAKERPTIVLIDDLHFAPHEGRALFAALAMGVPGHRILLVGTTRPGLPEDWISGVERLPHAECVQLARLGAQDLTRLLVDFFQSERLAEELGFRIAAKSDGNPFFVFEIIRGLREGQFLSQREDGTWVTTKIIERIEIPSSVADLIHARMTTLAEEDREVLDVASCCGFEFDGTLVAEAIGAARIPTFRRLARIEKTHRLVRAAGRNYVFDHHQVQESLYAGLPEVLREEYHAALGDALEKRALRASDHVQLCEHFFDGGRPERAKPHLENALQHLDKGYVFEVGLGLLERALAAPGLYEGKERVEKLIAKARRLALLGRRDEERAASDEARALADKGDDLRARAKARIAQAAFLGNTSQFEPAAELAREVLKLGVEMGDVEIEAIGHEYLAIIATGRGRQREASDHFEKAIVLHEQFDDPRGTSNLLDNQGGVQRELGNYDASRKFHEQARDVAQKSGDLEGVGNAIGNLGNLCRSQGRLGDTLDHYERCTDLFRQIGARRPMASVLANLAELCVPLGDLERGRETAERAAALCEEIQFGYIAAWLQMILGRIAANEGKPKEADARFSAALERMRAFPSPPEVSEILRRQAELRGSEQARPLLTEALEIVESIELPAETVLVRASLALLPGGDVHAARAAFEQHGHSLALRSRMRACFLLWKATHDRDYLGKARDVLAGLVEHAPERFRETMIKNVPLHREITAACDGGPQTA